jgi:hypothetical protein
MGRSNQTPQTNATLRTTRGSHQSLNLYFKQKSLPDGFVQTEKISLKSVVTLLKTQFTRAVTTTCFRRQTRHRSSYQLR